VPAGAECKVVSQPRSWRDWEGVKTQEIPNTVSITAKEANLQANQPKMGTTLCTPRIIFICLLVNQHFKKSGRTGLLNRHSRVMRCAGTRSGEYPDRWGTPTP